MSSSTQKWAPIPTSIDAPVACLTFRLNHRTINSGSRWSLWFPAAGRRPLRESATTRHSRANEEHIGTRTASALAYASTSGLWPVAFAACLSVRGGFGTDGIWLREDSMMPSTHQPPVATPRPILVCPDCTNDDQSLLDTEGMAPGWIYCVNCSHTFKASTTREER